MVDYSFPVGKRTRAGKRGLISDQYWDHRKKKTKKNRADSACANVRPQLLSDTLGKYAKTVNLSEDCSINRRVKTEYADLSDDSDASLKEIDAATFSKEGCGSITYVASSSGLENVKKFKLDLEGTEKRNLDAINLKDEVISIDAEEGFDSMNSRCSISNSAGKIRDFICVDVDNEDCSMEKRDLVISPNKSMGGSNCLNSNGCESGSGSYRAELKEQENSEEFSLNAVKNEFTESESKASSSGEDCDDPSDYELEKSDELLSLDSSESSSSDSGKENESFHVENKSFHAGSRRGPIKGGKFVEAGLRRMKSFGLDILKNEDDEPSIWVACRTRSRTTQSRTTQSRFTSRFINAELGTFSQPLCIDEEESDFPCNEKELDSPGNEKEMDDESDLPCNEKELDSSSGHDNNDSSDDTNSDVEGTQKCGRKASSTIKKIEFDNASDGDSYRLKSFHGGKKTWHDKKAPGTYKGNQSECVQKDHPNICNSDSSDDTNSDVEGTQKCGQKAWITEKKIEFDNASDGDSYRVKSFHAGKKTWHDKKAPGTFEGNQSECVQKDHPNICKEFTNVTKIKLPRGNLDVCNILVDSIIEDKELPYVNSHVAELSLPLEYYSLFEDLPPEKSEHEKELDNLWAELEFGFRSSEIGVANSDMAENKDDIPSNVKQANLCHHGDHRLILDEEVGLICTICSYVKLEIKDILPSFDTSPYGKSQKRESNLFDHSAFDNLEQDLECDPHNGSDPHAHCGRTVWDIIPGIRNSMYPHQREGFEFIWKNVVGGINLDELKERNGFENGSGCIISHAPGTGKSRLTIVFLQTLMELYPTCRPMIIAPSTMLLTWEEEFLKWNVDIPFHNLNKRDCSLKENSAAVNFLMQACPSRQSVKAVRLVKLFSWKKERSILGISYKLFEQLAGVRKNSKGDKVRKILLELPDLVVFDEGHIPRNDDSFIWRAVSKIKTERRIILSGTPFQNNFDEFYNILWLVRPKFADTNNKSKENGCFEKKRGRPRNITKERWCLLTSSIGKASEDLQTCDKLKEVRNLITPFVHVYRGDILKEKLPGLKKSVVILQPAELQRSLLQTIHTRKGSFAVEYAESLISVHPSLLLKIDKEDYDVNRDMLEKSRLNPELGVKIKLLLEIIRLSEALNEKILVFSQYIAPLSFIEEHLKYHFNWTEGTEMFHMSGKCDLKKRQSLINTFNDPTSEVRVLLASTKACSEGINLIGASRVILLDVAWNPSVERQAICRAYRLGQKKVVYIYHLITSGAKEEEKYSRQVHKDRLSELVFSPDSGKNQENLSSTVLDDIILEAMLKHEKLKNMFQKIAYQSKESAMSENFDLEENQ